MKRVTATPRHQPSVERNAANKWKSVGIVRIPVIHTARVCAYVRRWQKADALGNRYGNRNRPHARPRYTADTGKLSDVARTAHLDKRFTDRSYRRAIRMPVRTYDKQLLGSYSLLCMPPQRSPVKIKYWMNGRRLYTFLQLHSNHILS